jgi:hypothetical protein
MKKGLSLSLARELSLALSLSHTHTFLSLSLSFSLSLSVQFRCMAEEIDPSAMNVTSLRAKWDADKMQLPGDVFDIEKEERTQLMALRCVKNILWIFFP